MKRYPTPLPPQRLYIEINLDDFIAKIIQIAAVGLIAGWLTAQIAGY